MIAIKKIAGASNYGFKNPIFEVLSFPSLVPTGETIAGFANARRRASELSVKAGKKNWIMSRLGSDKMYPIDQKKS